MIAFPIKNKWLPVCYAQLPLPSSPPWGPWWLDCLSNQTHQLDQWSNHPSQGPTPGLGHFRRSWLLTVDCMLSEMVHILTKAKRTYLSFSSILRFNVFIHKRALRKFHVREWQLYNYVISIIISKGWSNIGLDEHWNAVIFAADVLLHGATHLWCLWFAWRLFMSAVKHPCSSQWWRYFRKVTHSLEDSARCGNDSPIKINAKKREFHGHKGIVMHLKRPSWLQRHLPQSSPSEPSYSC